MLNRIISSFLGWLRFLFIQYLDNIKLIPKKVQFSHSFGEIHMRFVVQRWDKITLSGTLTWLLSQFYPDDLDKIKSKIWIKRTWTVLMATLAIFVAVSPQPLRMASRSATWSGALITVMSRVLGHFFSDNVRIHLEE